MSTLRYDNRKSGLPFYLKIVYFIYFFTLFNRDLRYTQVVWYSANIITLIASFYRIISAQGLKIQLNLYFHWIILFAGWGVISYKWALNVADVIDASQTVILSYTVFYLIYKCISDWKDLVSLLRIILWAAVITSVCIFALTNLKLVLFSGLRLGYETTGKNWNANDIGLFASKAALIAMSFIYEHRRNSAITKLMLAVVSLIVILSGSRKALIVFALYILLFSIYKSEKGRFQNSLIALAVILISIFFIFENSYLYGLIGKRIFAMISGLFLGGTNENSFNEHSMLITSGIVFFKQSPIIGHGLMNYHILFHRIYPWDYTAHNNYIELLVDLGIVGFILYYSIEVYMVFKMIKDKIYRDSTESLIIYIMLICDFLTQFACIAFDDPACTMLIMLGMSAIKVFRSREITSTAEVIG